MGVGPSDPPPGQPETQPSLAIDYPPPLGSPPPPGTILARRGQWQQGQCARPGRGRTRCQQAPDGRHGETGLGLPAEHAAEHGGLSLPVHLPSVVCRYQFTCRQWSVVTSSPTVSGLSLPVHLPSVIYRYQFTRRQWSVVTSSPTVSGLSLPVHPPSVVCRYQFTCR